MSLLIERRELLDRFKRASDEPSRRSIATMRPRSPRSCSAASRFSSRGARSASPATRSRSISTTRCRRPSCAPSRSRRASATTGCIRTRATSSPSRATSSLDEFRNREVAMSPFIDQLDSGGEPAESTASTTAKRRRRRATVVGRPVARASPPSRSSCASELGRLYAAFVARLDDRDRTFFRHRFEEQQTQVEAGAAQRALAHAGAHAREEAAPRVPRVHADERLPRSATRRQRRCEAA